MVRARRLKRGFSFGGRMPWGVGLLLALTVVSSLLVAFTSRHAAPLFGVTALVPEEVWRGQLWRLVTWPFIQPSPIGLIFTGFIFYWFGSDVALHWGSRRFVSVFGGVMALAGVATCLIARLDPSVLTQAYLGAWALTAALTVAWGFWFPERTVRIYLVLPIQGYWLAWLTIAITVVCSVYWGWETLLPELLAEGGVLTWIFRRRIRAFVWPKAKTARRAPKKKAASARESAENVAYLRLVESDDQEPPALSKDMEKRVSELISGRKTSEGE
jgi:membrane associated rhomboid family serine protease